MNTSPTPDETISSPPARAARGSRPWRQFPLPGQANRSYLLRRWLPLLGVALLLCWLSQYFLSANWQTLLQMLSAPGAPRGGVPFLALALLIAQTLAMVGAWSALLGLMVREALRPLKALHGNEVAPDQPAASLAPAPGAGAAISQDHPRGEPPARSQPSHTAPAEPAPPPAQQGQFMHFLSTSGEQSWPAVRVPPAAPAPQQRDVPTEQRPVPGRAGRGNPGIASAPQPAKVEPAAKVAGAPAADEARSAASPSRSIHDEDELWEEDALAQEEDSEFLAVLSTMGFLPAMPARPGEVSDEKKPQPRRGPEKIAAQHIPPRPKGVRSARIQRVDEDGERKRDSSPYDVQQAALSDESTQVFVFGNPFEGPLPDVFQHDEDLKRSLLEQKQTMQMPLSPHERAQTRAKQPPGDKRSGTDRGRA